MRIILTHEQADFDAIASLFCAHLLDENAVPVLPYKINRNVRAFLTLYYGAELLFTDPRDLSGTKISQATLVDTQANITVKGMYDDTQIMVVDHHTLKENNPPNWQVTVENVGAATTLFVESLRQREITLSSISATLLLLGIYEDTGSLSYVGTTPRDVHAAAYLLEQGASLRIAANYLNQPLSSAQRMLYDVLLANAEMINIQDQWIAISCANVQGNTEELSTLAHKMRDLLEPDGLFLLIATAGGVQMIARSTSDRINVAAIAASFGGGGHARAAAGWIKDRSLEEVRQELLRILPQHVSPAITVAQIMSRGPQVLSADTSVEEAADRMQRFGYEGYPVVEDGQVLGLLTRRAVDRALAHHLHLSVSSLMEAGQVTVLPSDSLRHLQRTMIDTGWGQIPVVDAQTGQIIGIVTRTDLLKMLAPEARTPDQRNLTEHLEKALPPVRLALLKAVADQAKKQHVAIYIVGGFVRDLLLDRPSLDFDIVVEGDAIVLAQELQKRFGGRVTSHGRFGTAKWHIAGNGDKVVKKLNVFGLSEAQMETNHLPPTLDLVTARTEFYSHPTALPTVERGSIKLDLHRRDFTINTLALRLDGRHYGELHDYWGGLSDIRRGLVRVLHSLSFVDDPTRMLRAVRFEQRFGFHIGDRTLELMQQAQVLLDRVSGDRIRHELDVMLDEPRTTEIFARLEELGLLKSIHPDLGWDGWLSSRFRIGFEQLIPSKWGVEHLRTPFARALGYIFWMMRLSETSASQICVRLKISRALSVRILSAGRLWRQREPLSLQTPSQFVRSVEDMPPLSRYAVFLAVEDETFRQKMLTYINEWQNIAPKTTGEQLKALGIPPGPKYGQILNTLRSAYLDGQITNFEQEKSLLQTLIQQLAL